MPLKHVYWFSHYNMEAPSTRYRAKYALDNLATKEDVTFSFVTPGYSSKNVLHFLKVYFSVLLFRKKDSLIVFQRIYTRRLYAAALKILLFFRKQNSVYDLDDAEYLNFPPGTIHHFMKNCSVCTVGSKSLLEYAKKFNRSVVLNTSPVIAHRQLKQDRNSVLTIGWIGFYNTGEKGNSHKQNIYALFLPGLLKLDFKVKFIVLGLTNPTDKAELVNYFAENKNIQIETPSDIDWQNEFSVYEKIKELDIGISPLFDNEENRAKSAFKLKQYFSCGVPALGSAVGENETFLKNGINGFICGTPEDYTRMICKIKSMSNEDYKQLSENTLATVKEFTMDLYCRRLSYLNN